MAAPLTGRQRDQDSVLEVPSTKLQRGGATAPRLPSSQRGEDKLPRLEGQPNRVAQIPQRFLGCWNGEVSTAELTMMRVFDYPIIARWLTKDYELCFIRTDDGSYKVTMTDSGVEKDVAVIDSRSSLTPISVDTESLALNGRLVLVERSTDIFGDVIGPACVVDEHVALQGHLDDGGQMRVRGHVDGFYDGRPWFVAAWITDFRRE